MLDSLSCVIKKTKKKSERHSWTTIMSLNYTYLNYIFHKFC